jgi:hypothetical protein
LETTHDRVEDCPDLIEAGLAVKDVMTGGVAASATIPSPFGGAKLRTKPKITKRIEIRRSVAARRGKDAPIFEAMSTEIRICGCRFPQVWFGIASPF